MRDVGLYYIVVGGGGQRGTRKLVLVRYDGISLSFSLSLLIEIPLLMGAEN